MRDARRLTATTLDGVADGLADDAELVVTELVTNAVLHGASPIHLRVRGRRHRVRIEVSDSGQSLPLRPHRRSDGMTGRGLEVIESLATSWGMEPTAEGKLVWAELGRPRLLRSRRSERPSLDTEPLAAKLDAVDIHYPVRLGWVPTELLLAAKAHIDNILRELALMRGSDEGDLAIETIGRLANVADDFAEARVEIKRQALAAARRKSIYTDLTLSLPLSSVDAGIRYLAALDEADCQARSNRLLTLAAPPSHRVFREWYVRAIIDQLRAAAHGEPAPTPTTFALVLAEELDRVAGQESPDSRGGA